MSLHGLSTRVTPDAEGRGQRRRVQKVDSFYFKGHIVVAQVDDPGDIADARHGIFGLTYQTEEEQKRGSAQGVEGTANRAPMVISPPTEIYLAVTPLIVEGPTTKKMNKNVVGSRSVDGSWSPGPLCNFETPFFRGKHHLGWSARRQQPGWP